MRDEHFDEAFERMRTELNVTPSPEFAAKVRQQNAATPARSSWSRWAWAGAAAACAVAVIAFAIWPGPAANLETHTARDLTPPVAAESPGVTAQATAPPSADSSRGTASATARVATRRDARIAGTPAPVIVAAAATTELEVLVPPDQLDGIRRLMNAVRRGADVQVAPPQPRIDPDTGELIAPKPIEIPLITVTPLPGDPEGRSGGRENR